MSERLQKLIANAGYGSRRWAEKLIEQGISIPIIFISGHGNVGLSTKVFKKGAMEMKYDRNEHL